MGYRMNAEYLAGTGYDKSTDSLVEIAEATENIRNNVGTNYYVSNVSGSDSNDGLSPRTPKATITAAITAASAGDIITIEAGTYAEDVNVNKNSLELYFEIGAIIAAQSGAGLTVSAHYCKIQTPGGALRVNPITNGTGVLLSGNWTYLWNVRVPCGSSADLGFDITGDGGVLTDCRCSDPLIAAFKVQGDKVKLEKCCTGGTPADTSIGYWVTSTANKTRLRDCASQGHASGGFVVDSGATNCENINPVSGGGDGPRLDPTHACVRSNYTYDDLVTKEITFAGAPTEYNIFKVTGVVRVTDIYGMVETEIANTTSTLHLEVYSTGGTVDITDSPGTDIDSAVVGSYLVRKEASTVAISLASAATPSIVETTTWRDPKNPIDIIADYDQTTYIRLVLSAALASGKIHWHCHYEPKSDGAFVEAA